MTHHEFCPCCGIGLSNNEKNLQFCNNCRTDFKGESKDYDDDYDGTFWDAEDEEENDYLPSRQKYKEDGGIIDADNEEIIHYP